MNRLQLSVRCGTVNVLSFVAEMTERAELILYFTPIGDPPRPGKCRTNSAFCIAERQNLSQRV
jgi:hypothetical protein